MIGMPSTPFIQATGNQILHNMCIVESFAKCPRDPQNDHRVRVSQKKKELRDVDITPAANKSHQLRIPQNTIPFSNTNCNNSVMHSIEGCSGIDFLCFLQKAFNAVIPNSFEIDGYNPTTSRLNENNCGGSF